MISPQKTGKTVWHELYERGYNTRPQGLDINQRTEGPESCQDKFLADALLNEAYMSK